MTTDKHLQQKSINALRFLSVDGVFNANSGHPGLPMGTAAIAYTIWTRHLRFNPKNPAWPNRDRFVLSGGHGSMLLYSLLHLTGFDVSLEDLKNFRQLDSITPGHPEVGITPGVETTTGPLGQGFANGVGMAVAETHLASLFNTEEHPLIDHFVYAIVTDGDLMEGVASEAASFAGHQRLSKLIYLYDDNRISIDGSTELTFTEDRGARFMAYGWQVQYVADGNDVDEIDQAIINAKADPKPSLIVCRTHIGYGLPTKQDTAEAHGTPPTEAELKGAKVNLGWPVEPLFYIPNDVLTHFRTAIERGTSLEEAWNRQFIAFKKIDPEKAGELSRRLNGELTVDWDKSLPVFDADPKGMATRKASGIVLNAIANQLPELIGGSADLAPSNNTWINDSPDFQPDTRAGRNFHFGVREHGMASIVNGMALHGGVIPYGATFLVFTDYLRPALRLSALSHIPSIWVMTHDSIGLGEDGPTHQPVEQLASMRAIPHLTVIRPADANEVTVAWKLAVANRHGPTVLVLTRQNLPVLDRNVLNPADGVEKGAYVLADLGDGRPQMILMASGSEVPIILEAGYRLASSGINLRIVSFPSWELFEQQPQSYRDSVLPPTIEYRLAVEAGVSQGWERWTGTRGMIIAVNTFGASAPYQQLYQKFGLTADNVVGKARLLLGISE